MRDGRKWVHAEGVVSLNARSDCADTRILVQIEIAGGCFETTVAKNV